MERRYPTQPIVAVGAVVVRGEQVLLAQRGQEPGLGRWTLPGGALELGETVREALARELREECGIQVEIGELLGVFDRVLKDQEGRVAYHYVIIDFAARWKAGEPRPGSDIAQLKWVRAEEIEEPLLAELARKAIAQFRARRG